MLGNVIGFEIGNKAGPVIYEHDGKILKRSYFDRTENFFDDHGRMALVIGRFVPVVRTYVTVVAGASKMKRPRFLLGASSAPWPGSSASRSSATSWATVSRSWPATSTT